MDKAFLKFDRTGNGSVNVQELRVVYNAALHPLVQSHKITEKQASDVFFNNFVNASRDGAISRLVDYVYMEEWNDYYTTISSLIHNDDHYVQCVISAWRL